MTSCNFDWLDRPFYDDDREFGRAREELSLAEETFHPDMPDDLLLRLYYFVQDRADENETWEVIQEQTELLMRSRLYGGPRKRPAKYARGFDAKDHAAALEAMREDALPTDDLLSLYQVAEVNRRAGKIPSGFEEAWQPIFPLVRDQILARMPQGRARAMSAPTGGGS